MSAHFFNDFFFSPIFFKISFNYLNWLKMVLPGQTGQIIKLQPVANFALMKQNVIKRGSLNRVKDKYVFVGFAYLLVFEKMFYCHWKKCVISYIFFF